MVKRKYPDTDMEDADILLEAQQQEYKVSGAVGISTTPTDAATLSDMQLAVALLTASELEGREPHSRADGSVREDKYSRVLWMKEAKDIIRSYQTDVPVGVTRYGD
jgi:hypothetical protein